MTTPPPATTPPHPHTTNPTSPTAHACFFCRQVGQPVWPITLTLKATELTPAIMPDEIEVDTWACLDTATCARLTAARRSGTTERMQ